jgi:hypothetical protein
MMLDINGQALHEGDTAQLLCEVTDISDRGVLVRVMNSELELMVDAKHDEVLGGLVAGSELTLFETANNLKRDDPACSRDDPADGVKVSFE